MIKLATSKLKIMHKDANGKTNSETFNTTLNTNIGSDTAVAINTWALAYCNLSTDTYDDTEITSTQSINEILAGE